MTKKRGFKKLKGVTISRVDASCINSVSMWSADGQWRFTIEAELSDGGIPGIILTRKKVKSKVPKQVESVLAPIDGE